MRILAEYGAGIGAIINLDDQVWEVADLQHCAFFGATNSNGYYNYGQVLTTQVNNEMPGFKDCAIVRIALSCSLLVLKYPKLVKKLNA